MEAALFILVLFLIHVFASHRIVAASGGMMNITLLIIEAAVAFAFVKLFGPIILSYLQSLPSYSSAVPE